MDSLGRDENGRRPGDFRFAWTLIRVLAEQRARMTPALEVRGLGRAAFALVANCDPYTYVGPVPLRVAPEARFELGLDVVGARELRPGALPRFLTYVLEGGGQQRARDVLYGHDLDELRGRVRRAHAAAGRRRGPRGRDHGDLRVRAGRNLGAGLSV